MVHSIMARAEYRTINMPVAYSGDLDDLYGLLLASLPANEQISNGHAAGIAIRTLRERLYEEIAARKERG